jgi:pimeloyl-ACP methyl ester carboxylesterase
LKPLYRNLASVFLALLFAGPVTPACAEKPAPSGLWPGLRPGRHAVGYKVEHLYDRKRSFPGTSGKGRPVQISLWYPASSVERLSRITWRDYFLSAATEVDFSTPDESRRLQHLEEVRGAAKDAGAEAARFETLLGGETLAYLDAPVADGPHPLVVFVPGFGAPSFQNTVAFEYLASHGFEVASIPSTGANGREMTSDEAGVTAQVEDIAFVMGAVPDLLPIDRDRVGLVGYSWGGLTVTLAAMRGAKVSALVALDPTLMVKKGHTRARSFDGYDPSTLTMPVLVMIANAKAFKERDVSFFDELSGSDKWLLRFNDLKHGDFGSIIIRFFVHTIPGGGGRDVDRIDAGYAAACRYLLAFLDAHLNNDSEARKFLARSPEDDGLPTGVVSVERH